MKRFIVFFIILCVSLNLLKAQDFRIRAVLDTNAILIGQQTYLRIQIEQKNGMVFIFPQYYEKINRNIEVLEQLPIDTLQQEAEKAIIEKAYKITSFTPGKIEIPPHKVLLSYGSKTDTVTSNSLQFVINTLAVDTTKAIYDINPPIDTPLTFDEFWKLYRWYILAVIILILASIFIWYLLKKRKENKPVFKITKPKLPPHTIALSALEKLHDEKLWQQEKVKLYHSKLTEILRIYIEERFQTQAMEQTSEEIIEEFKNNSLLSSTSLENLSQILRLSDLVKFAKHKPLPDENDKSYRLAYEFVKNTMQQAIQDKEPDDENKSNDEK